jgi:hypothetical protein
MYFLLSGLTAKYSEPAPDIAAPTSQRRTKG